MDDETMELVMRLQLENVPEVNRQDMFGRTQLTEFGEFVEVFAELICTSQEFVRAVHGGERSAVSLRDVARCIKVFLLSRCVVLRVRACVYAYACACACACGVVCESARVVLSVVPT